MAGHQSSPLLSLPGELRTSIYNYVFTQDTTIEIKRRPISLWCEDTRQWYTLDGKGHSHGPSSHRECDTRIARCRKHDLYLEQDVQTHSEHFPCPQSIAGQRLNLELLLTCRQIYYEARKLPFSLNSLVTSELGTFSNFLYCLKSWQVGAITNLAFKITEEQGMTLYLAEWNDLFSLAAASFSSLRTLAVQVQLYDPGAACWSSFWDAGLLELDRLELQSVHFTILDQYMHPWYAFSATTPECASGCFHACRDRLRREKGHNRDDDADIRIFFRYASSPCPLYTRNLVNLLTRRGRSDSAIRNEDKLQRDYAPYQYFQSPDFARRRTFGYQFNSATTPKIEIDRNLAKLRLSRERLAQKLTLRDDARTSHRDRDRHFSSTMATRPSTTFPQDQPVSTKDDVPGQWRRLLNEETYAPFFESFPMTVGENHASGRVFECIGCSENVGAPRCFLSQTHVPND